MKIGCYLKSWHALRTIPKNRHNCTYSAYVAHFPGTGRVSDEVAHGALEAFNLIRGIGVKEIRDMVTVKIEAAGDDDDVGEVVSDIMGDVIGKLGELVERELDQRD